MIAAVDDFSRGLYWSAKLNRLKKFNALFCYTVHLLDNSTSGKMLQVV
jgi:hypothetical protein